MQAIMDPDHGILISINEIKGIGHRVVHGGDQYSASVVIDDDVIEAIRVNCELAPLHNPANLTGIIEAGNAFPGIPQVAVFDTAFHQTLPPSAYLYGIPREFYEKYRIRRYGFHGTSHRYVQDCHANDETEPGKYQYHHLTPRQWRFHHCHPGWPFDRYFHGLHTPGRSDDGNP